MPEHTDSPSTTTGVETNPMMISASDILKERPQHGPKGETDEPETDHDETDDERDEEGESEEEKDEDDELADEGDGDKKEEEEEDEDDLEDETDPVDKPTRLQLDPALAKTLPPLSH